MMTTKQPEIIDVVDEDDAELLAAVAETDDALEPSPEPPGSVAADLLELMTNMEDINDEEIDEEDTTAMAEACGRVALGVLSAASAGTQPMSEVAGGHPSPAVQAILEEYVVAEEDEEPSWLEKKLGPWVARHRTGLRVWLLGLLVVYVSLFASMVYQDGLRGLSERTHAAIVRDLLWAVLIGLIVLLSIGKQY